MPRIKGVIFIRNLGRIFIGTNVVINSNWVSNPIGWASRTSIIVDRAGELKIGDGVGISNTSIVCQESITIENNVYIGGGCKIYDTDFHSINYYERISVMDKGKTAPIVIRKGAFIGAGCTLLKGVVIGEYSVIGAGSIVTKKIPAYQIWGGNPARYIRDLNEEERYELYKLDKEY